MDKERLLIRSQRNRVWRTLEPLVLVPAVVGGFRLWTGDWGGWISVAWALLLSALPVTRLILWSRCPDVWDDGEHLIVRRGGEQLRSVAWRDLSSVHFGYHPSRWPQWHAAKHIRSLPAIRVTLKGQPFPSVYTPGFADLLLFGNSWLSAEAALAEACQRHGVQLMSPTHRSDRYVDLPSRRDAR